MEEWSFISKEQAESSPLNAGCEKTSFYFCLPQQWNCSETQVQQFNISLTTATEGMTALDNNHLPIPWYLPTDCESSHSRSQ